MASTEARILVRSCGHLTIILRCIAYTSRQTSLVREGDILSRSRRQRSNGCGYDGPAQIELRSTVAALYIKYNNMIVITAPYLRVGSYDAQRLQVLFDVVLLPVIRVLSQQSLQLAACSLQAMRSETDECASTNENRELRARGSNQLPGRAHLRHLCARLRLQHSRFNPPSRYRQCPAFC